MIIHNIQSDIEAIEKNSVLYEGTSFESRAQAIDYLEFNIIDRIDGLSQTINPPGDLSMLKQWAERIKYQLEYIDSNLFQQLRAEIGMGVYRGATLKSLFDEYVRGASINGEKQDVIGYDNLDVFINGLLLANTLPIETKVREPEMLYYQQTPARIIIELIKKANFTTQDVFYDLGSGLGQVPILVDLLSEAKAKGVEFEPAYCDYARGCAAELNLSGIEFINVDARIADYADGTVFYMYTPFEGRLLQEVLEKLHRESRRKMIRLFTYGSCTLEVSQQSWLKCINQNGNRIYKLAIFKSL